MPRIVGLRPPESFDRALGKFYRFRAVADRGIGTRRQHPGGVVQSKGQSANSG